MTKVIIDTDPGTDDALALMMALGSPDLDVLGLTTVGGNARLADTTRNTLRLLDYLGRTDIPGIVPDFLLGAPTFGEIAGDLVDALAGCVPVAHNAGFDVRFVCSEWERCGLGPLALDAVDTLPLARRLGLRGRLVDLAVDLEVALPDAHRALDDTRALAGVLAALLARGAVPPSVPPFSRPLLSPTACDRVHQRPRVAT